MRVGGTIVSDLRGLRQPKAWNRRRKTLVITGVVLLAIIGFVAYQLIVSSSVRLRSAVSTLQFYESVADTEKQIIEQALQEQEKKHKGSLAVHVKTALTTDNTVWAVGAYVPVAPAYAVRQQLTKAELAGTDLYVPAGLDETVRKGIASTLGVSPEKLTKLTTPPQNIPDTAVAFIPPDQLSPQLKLLTFEGNYYLDSFDKGAVFRQVAFSGKDIAVLDGLKLNSYADKGLTLKVNMTGVTALTRRMITTLNSVQDGAYFGQKIGAFLADADITHVSNEVSFKEGCAYHNSSFCSPPAMVETLKASGVDLVELTGNHNNDAGNMYNTETINLYHSLGWKTIGGGLNKEEAAKPYLADQKGSKVLFLAYNYADGLNSGAIAGATTAGANHFDIEKIKADIAAAKHQSNFIIVNIQFWECYAYPDGYLEYPQCDTPIPTQKEIFRQVADLGADMVVGSSAHQPQTYELYDGKPIYYGLGNMYFDQTQWPGTERGIILTHYFVGGKLVQTKLSPTVYDKAFQAHLMDADDAAYLLERLKKARATAGL